MEKKKRLILHNGVCGERLEPDAHILLERHFFNFVSINNEVDASDFLENLEENAFSIPGGI